MPAFDGSNPHPLYLGLAFCGAVLFFGTFMGLLMWNNKRKGYSRMESDPAGPAPERTSRPRPTPAASTYTIAPAAPAVAEPAPPAGPRPLGFADLWAWLGERCIHLLIVGETHSGKSTSARAVLAGRIAAGDEIVIFDPHATPATWAGLRAVGAGRDFAAIEAGMAAVLGEMTARYQELANNADYRPRPLTIFVDEWSAIQTACKKTAAQFITELAQEGRKAGMRLVMLTQSDLVASLGIEGKGDVRENFLFLLLGQKAAARCPAALELARPAALRRGEGTPRAAQVEPLEVYSNQLDTSMAVLWPGGRWGQNHGKTTAENSRPATPAVDQKYTESVPKNAPASDQAAPARADLDPNLDPLWQRFLNGESLLEPETGTSTEPAGGADFGQKLVLEPVPENAGLADTNGMVLVSSDQAPVAAPGTSTGPDDELSVAIRALLAVGMSRNKVTQLLPIPGNRAAQLARIKQALGESEGGAQ